MVHGIRPMITHIIQNLVTRLRPWISHQPDFRNLPSALDEVKKNTPDAFDYFWASDYAKTQYLEPARKELLRHISSVIGQYARRNILDIGCGPGYLLNYVINEESIHITGPVVGMDYSKEAIVQAGNNIQGAFFTVADATQLPLTTGSFSCVSCIETLEHIKDPKPIINELIRVTSKGGAIIIGVPNGELDTWDGHQHFFTTEELRNLFTDTQVLHEEYINNNRNIIMVFER